MHPDEATGDARGQAIQRKLADAQVNFGHLVVRDFPRSLRGYERAAVDRHLEHIGAWLSLSGLDQFVRERFNEQDPLGRALRTEAENHAAQLREDARRDGDRRMEEARDDVRRLREAADQEAERIRAAARQDAEMLLADARAAHQDAEEIKAKAQQEAHKLLAEARAEAAAQGRRPLARLLSRRVPDR